MNNRVDTIKTFCKENLFILSAIALVVLFQIYYINLATANVPIMDYWRFINEITEKVFTGTLAWADFWTSAGAHIDPFLYLTLAINMRFFGLNTRIEIFAGIFMMLLIALMLYVVYQRIMIKELGYQKGVTQAMYLPLVFAIFNFNQWEILTLEFSFVVMCRIFAFISIFILLDNFLRDLHGSIKKALVLGFIIALIICTMSGGYFPSMVGAVLLSTFFHILLHRKTEGLRYFKEYILLLVLIGTGSIIYLSGVTLSGSGGSISSFISGFFNGEVIKDILIMLGGSIIPIELTAKYGGLPLYYILGIIVLAFYIGATILFFTNKMWKHNYLPMTLIFYAVLNMILIIYARASVFGSEYLASSRYVCETTLGLIGVLWILNDALMGGVKNGKIKKYITKAGCIIGILFISISLIQSAVIETHIAPYRKIYDEKAIGIMLNIQRVSDENLSIFQAGNPVYVRNGVELMEKYHLGVFHSDKQLKEYAHFKQKPIGTTLDSAEWVNGKNDDGWVGKTCEFQIQSGTNGKLIFTGYYPNKITGNETGTIYVNGKATPFIISEHNFTIEVNAPIQSVVKVKIENKFSFAAKPPDGRILSFILSNVQGQ